MKIKIIKKGLPKAQFGIGSMYGAFNNVTNKSVNNPPAINYNPKQQAFAKSLMESGNINIGYTGQPESANIQGQPSNQYTWGSTQTPEFQTGSKTQATGNPIYGDVNNLKSLLSKGAGRKELKSAVNNFNQTYGSDMKVPFGYMGQETKNTLNKVGNIAEDVRMGIGVTNALVDTFITNPRINKENKERARMAGMTDSLVMAAPEDRGDWVASGSRRGELRPDQYTVNKGMYTGQFYPQMNMMAYGGSAVEDDLYSELPMNIISNPIPKVGSVQSVLPPFMDKAISEMNYMDAADFIKKQEGFIPKAKWDYAQNSVGYGTKANYPGEEITKEEAQKRLSQELAPVVENIKKRLRVPVTSGQLIALASLNYNTGSLANRLIEQLNNGADPKLIENRIKTMALTGVGSKKILPGLVRRRQEESELFGRGFQTGGEFNDYNEDDMKTLRIKITASPDLDMMNYGGQNNYGLDLGQRNVYSDMIENPYDQVGDTLGPVDREDANIEAERGETIVGDFNSDGRLKHMKIAGKPHTQGGTPLNAPEQSFVFSQTKKMSIGGPALKLFGKSENSKSKFTPAQLAKQYDLNKYQAVLDDPNADYISKNTAQRMLNNNTRKLGMLALVQEGKKGFPNGIPDLAKSLMPQQPEFESEGGEEGEMPMGRYGGFLQRMGPGGGPTPRVFTSKEDFEKEKSKGYKQVGDFWEKRTSYEKQKAIPATKGKSYIPNENAWWKGLSPAEKAAHNAKVRNMVKTNPIYTGTPGKAAVMGENIDRISFMEPPTSPINSLTVPENKVVTNQQTDSYGRRPFFNNSLFVTPQRERFYAAPMAAMTPEPTFYDPNRQLAANAEQANITQQYLASMGSPESFMANASGVNAKAFENAANTNAQFQNMNVGVANQFAPMQADIINKMNAYNADRADKLYWNQQQGEKAYRTNQRQYLNEMDKYRQNEYDIKTKTNMLNQTNPYYDLQYGPRGGSIAWKPGVNVADLIKGGRGSASNSGMSYEQYLNEVRALKNSNKDLTDAQISQALKLKYPKTFGATKPDRSLDEVNQGYFMLGGQNVYPF
jgi:GH24 family phage-related lysozyme (muramidase)